MIERSLFFSFCKQKHYHPQVLKTEFEDIEAVLEAAGPDAFLLGHSANLMVQELVEETVREFLFEVNR